MLARDQARLLIWCRYALLRQDRVLQRERIRGAHYGRSRGPGWRPGPGLDLSLLENDDDEDDGL
jgi:hypothetical protein